MKLLYLKLTNGYSDNFTYQENILPAKYVELGYDTYLLTSVRSTDEKGTKIDRKPQTYVNEYGVKIKLLSLSKKYGKYARKFDIYDNLEREIEAIEPDIIFSHSLQYFNFFDVIKYVKKHKNVRLYVDNHCDYIIQPVDNIKRVIYHKVIIRFIVHCGLPYVTKFYGVSPSRSTYLNEVYRIPWNKIETISQGGDERVIDKFDRRKERESLISRLNIPSDNLIIICGGGYMDEKKKIHSVLQAVNELQNVSVVVFGTFSESGKELADKWLKSNNVIYIGRLQGEDIYRYFVAADLAIFPGQHSVLWDQAVATGIPVILRRWKGMDYFNVNGNCQYLKSGEPEEIRNNILELLSNSRKRFNEMQAAAMGKAKIKFSYIEIARHTLHID